MWEKKQIRRITRTQYHTITESITEITRSQNRSQKSQDHRIDHRNHTIVESHDHIITESHGENLLRMRSILKKSRNVLAREDAS